MRNTEHIPLAFHCGLCPSTVGEERGLKITKEKSDQFARRVSDSHQSSKKDVPKAVFVDKMYARANAYHVIPLDTNDEVFKHNQEVHRLGNPKASAILQEHRHILICRMCVNEKKWAKTCLTCCYNHHFDHTRYLVFNFKIRYNEILLYLGILFCFGRRDERTEIFFFQYTRIIFGFPSLLFSLFSPPYHLFHLKKTHTKKNLPSQRITSRQTSTSPSLCGLRNRVF